MIWNWGLLSCIYKPQLPLPPLTHVSIRPRSDHGVIRGDVGAEAQDRKPAVWERPLRRHHGLRPAQSKNWAWNLPIHVLRHGKSSRLSSFTVLMCCEFVRKQTRYFIYFHGKNIIERKTYNSVISLLVSVCFNSKIQGRYSISYYFRSIIDQILKYFVYLWYKWNIWCKVFEHILTVEFISTTMNLNWTSVSISCVLRWSFEMWSCMMFDLTRQRSNTWASPACSPTTSDSLTIKNEHTVCLCLCVSVCVCSRGSRWWWQSSWQRLTLTSTSPSCIPAGSTLQVAPAHTHAQHSQNYSVFERNRPSMLPDAYPSLFLPLSVSVCLSQRWPMPCQTSIALWRTVCGPRSRGLTPCFGWLSRRLQPQTPADVSTRVCCKSCV